jgi:branched-chain amino acid transport system substrate-binding protein
MTTRTPSRRLVLSRSAAVIGAASTGLLLIQGANAVKGDIANKPALIKAMEGATIDSPRGKWTMSPSHNPVQDMYLRVVENKENKVLGVAAKALADSGAGCKMG